MESVTPVPRAEGETLRDCSAEIVQVSMSSVCAVIGCWVGGGTEL
jgi:hypothetical protein